VVVRRVRGIFFTLCFASVVALAACGGSDSESNETQTTDSAEQTTDAAATGDTVAEDPAVKLAAFCKSALDNQGGADISPDDDPAAIAEKLSANAAALSDMASVAPDEVKADADAVAAAASDMAEAIAGDPTLDKFNSLIEEFATSEANTASANVQTWVKDNCEDAQ
jgi:ABC-type Fe3+-hydroxamate transport system substrate-binding protein